MALSQQERTTVEQLHSEGYSQEEIQRHIGAQRAGRTSQITTYEQEKQVAREEAANGRGFFEQAGRFLLSDDAVTELGRGLAHGPLGGLVTTADGTPVREFLPAPERKKLGGALLQTGALVGDVALAPVSLPAQIGIGAGAGYAYDIGGNLVQDSSTSTPGGGVVAGALVPPAISGLGRALGTAAIPAGREAVEQALPPAPVREVEEVVPGTPAAPSGIAQRAREVGSFPSRVAGRVQEALDESTARATLRETVSPRGAEALDMGLDRQTVAFVDQFDEQTKQAARRIVDAAENPRAGVNPQEVPGEFMVNQYDDYIQPKLRTVGERIGELSDALPNQAVNMRQQHQVLNDILKQNRINVKNGRLQFENQRFTQKQQNLMQQMYDTVTTDQVLTPRQIHEFDQRISREYREGLVDGQLDNIFIEYAAENGTKQTQSIDQVFRDVMRKKLNEFSPTMREANTEYMLYKQLESDIRNTYLKQSNRLNVDPDLNVTAGVALRRIFSNAQSSAEYKAVAQKMDLISRQLGYEGANPIDLADFYLRDVKPLYPESVQPTSFEGGLVGGIRSALSSLADIGRVTDSDKQRALKIILGDEIAPPPTSAVDDIPLGMSIRKDVTPASVAARADQEDIRRLAAILDDPSLARIEPEMRRMVDNMGLGRATDDELTSFAKEVIDEFEGVADRPVN